MTLAAGLALIAGLNLYVDPSRRLLRRAATVDRAWSSDESLWVPDNFDEREFRAAHIRLIQRPDLLILGSSRAMEFHSGLFARDLRVYNSWVSAASLEDYVSSWQAIKESGKTPRFALILCDSWIFNENAPLVRWKTNARLYETFRAQQAGGAFAAAFAWAASRVDLAGLGGEELAELFSLDALKLSIKEIRQGKVGVGSGLMEVRIMPTTAAQPDRMAWRADGSTIYSTKQTTPHTLEELRATAHEYASLPSVFGISRYKFSPAKAAIFAGLLRDMAAHSTRVFIIIPPYHPAVLEELAGLPSYRAALPDHERVVKDLASSLGAEFCDALDPARMGCAETEFLDAMHMNAACVEKTLIRCFGNSPTWRPLLAVPPVAAR